MTDTVSPQVAEITKEHCEVFRWSCFGGVAPFGFDKCLALQGQMQKFLQALQSGTHGIYDKRTRVDVDAKQLREVSIALTTAAMTNPRLAEYATRVRGWLSPLPAVRNDSEETRND